MKSLNGQHDMNDAVHYCVSKMRNFVIISLIVLGVTHEQALAQQIAYNPNDERFKSLYLEKVQSDYKLQKEEFNRQETLHEKELISDKEFGESEGRFKNAQITFQQAILSLAFEQPHITIERAVKYQLDDGRKKVKLTLRNTTGGFIGEKPTELEDFDLKRTEHISNVYVSLLDDQHAIISRPYEAKIATMPYNQPVSVDFLLLRDIDNVIVKSIYCDKSEEKKILLQKDESANRMLITSEHFSQEADLGSRGNYDLKLELYSNCESTYRLEVLNLPREITYDFLESETNSRLSQVKFSPDIKTRNLSLAVYLGDRFDTSSFSIDKPITFFAAAIPEAQVKDVVEKGKRYSAGELDQMRIGYVRLELVPRGLGSIQLLATNFYQETEAGETLKMNLTIRNDGTRRLDNIKVWANVPLNWTSSVTPDLILSMLPGKEETVSLAIRPPEDATIGEYEATIKSESFASYRKIGSEDKKIRVHIAGRTSTFGTGLLFASLVVVVIAVVGLGVRMSRR